MANKHRIEQLKLFLEGDPNDTFSRYALALEYLQESPQDAKREFKILLEKFPDYLPTYYHAAALFIDLNLLEMARQTFERGIKKAEEKEELHALKELKSAFLNFQFEYED